MRRAMNVSWLLLLCGYACLLSAPQTPRATVFEGARLIVGDGSVVEDSAFVMEGTQFSRVGRRGSMARSTNCKGSLENSVLSLWTLDVTRKLCVFL
jgi:hypothetical protein